MVRNLVNKSKLERDRERQTERERERESLQNLLIPSGSEQELKLLD